MKPHAIIPFFFDVIPAKAGIQSLKLPFRVNKTPLFLNLPLLILFFLFTSVHAAVPSRIAYQGRLSKSGVGAAGHHTITVQFVDAAGNNLPYSQTFDVDVPASGDFQLEIQNIPPDADWVSDLPKMRVIVGGEVLAPDQPFSANPYALVARTVEDLDTSKVKLAPSNTALGSGLLSSWQSPTNPAGINASVIVGTITATSNHGINHSLAGTDPIPAGALSPTQTQGTALVLISSVTQTIQPTQPVVPLKVKGQPNSAPTLNMFEVWDNAASPTERFHIQGTGIAYFNGTVGIGTTSPSEKLDVSGGNMMLGSTSDLGGNNFGSIKFRTSSGTVGLRSSVSGVFGTTGNRRGLALDLQNDDTSAFEVVRDVAGPVFGVRATGQVYVGGNLGVGTANPTSKLEVAGGDIKVSGGIVSSSMTITGRYKDKTGDIMPPGIVLPFAGATIPQGWLLCDGTTYVMAAHPGLNDLRQALGATYGGDGVTTFQVPDLRGRTVIGTGAGSGLSNRALGESLGEEIHTLTIAEMPAHIHGVPNLTQYIPGRTGHVGGGTKNDGDIGTESTDSRGGSQPHNNMQPSLVLNYIIKY